MSFLLAFFDLGIIGNRVVHARFQSDPRELVRSRSDAYGFGEEFNRNILVFAFRIGRWMILLFDPVISTIIFAMSLTDMR